MRLDIPYLWTCKKTTRLQSDTMAAPESVIAIFSQPRYAFLQSKLSFKFSIVSVIKENPLIATKQVIKLSL